jgi:hypothetical protein
MSCTSVNIAGIESRTTITPAGPPLLIANLNPIRSECYTNQKTSIIYPQKYVGDTIVERAPVALGFQSFLGLNPNGYRSDNLTILDVLRSPSG